MSRPNLIITVDSIPTHTPETNTEKSIIYRLKNEPTGWIWDYDDNVWSEFDLGLASEPSYKVYTALLTQTGTDAPVATVLENTLGFTLVWEYIQVGLYKVTCSNCFPSGKTVIFHGNGNTDAYETSSSMARMYRSGDDDVYIITLDSSGTNENGNLVETPIEIRVYP